MEHFVKELIGKSDLSILTTKAVRKAYEAHIQKTLSSDEKKKLKLLVNDILEEIAKTMKESSPRKSPRKVPSVSASPVTTSENVEESSPRKSSRKVPSISASPVSSENIESRSDPQNLSENGDTASPKTVSETGSSSEISPPAKKSETKESRLPEVNLSETRETRSSPKKLLEDKTLQSTKPLKSPSKSSITANPKNAKRKSLSVREAVQSVLDSDKDEVGGVEINSESATDEEILVKKNKGHKRKLVSSDDDGEDITQDSDTSVVQLPVGKETSTPAKKPAAKKPLTKKQRILSEDESTDVNNSDILQDTLPEKKTAPKKPVPKSHVSSGDDSDDSGDDRLQIDVGVSSKTRTGSTSKGKRRRSNRPGRGVAKIKSYAESDSEMESLSSKSESVSGIEADVASEDSGVNMKLKSPSGKRKAKTKNVHKISKSPREKRIEGESESDVEDESTLKSQETITGDLTENEKHSDERTQEGKKRDKTRHLQNRNRRSNGESQISDVENKSLSHNVKEKSYCESEVSDNEDKRMPLRNKNQRSYRESEISDDDKSSTNKRSVFSLSETESDQNVFGRRRELHKAFRQRRISKLLDSEGFDVKQCTIVLERIDDQIDWVRKTAKVDVTSRKPSSRDSCSEMDVSSVSSKVIGRKKKKQKSKFPQCSTPVPDRKQVSLKKVIVSDSDDSDLDDTPLKSFKKKVQTKRYTPDSAFNSDDLPLKSLKKSRKSKNVTVNTDEDDDDDDDDDDPILSRSKTKRKPRALDSTFGSDLPLTAFKNRDSDRSGMEDLGNDELTLSLSKKKNKSKNKKKTNVLDSTVGSDDLPLMTIKKKGKGQTRIVDSDEDDKPLVSLSRNENQTGTKGKNGKQGSTFVSDDLPLTPLKNRRKNKSRTIDSDEDDKPFQPLSKNKKKSRALDSTFGSDDLPLTSYRKKGGGESAMADGDDVQKSKNKKSNKRIAGVRKSRDKSQKMSKNKEIKVQSSQKKMEVSSDEDSEDELLSDVKSKQAKKEADLEYQTEQQSLTTSQGDSSDDGDISCEPTRTSPRKLETGFDASPSASTRSHSVSPAKLKYPDIISESESGSDDVASLHDSIRSLEMLKVDKENLPMSNLKLKISVKKIRNSCNVSRADNSDSDEGGVDRSLRKVTARKRLQSGSDSDVSSIIEPQDDGGVTAVNGNISSSDSVASSAQNKFRLRLSASRTESDQEVDESEDSNQGDSQTEPLDTSKSNPTAAIESGDTATSVEIVQSPGKKAKKKKKKKKNKKKSSVAVDSDDAEMSMEVDEVPKRKGRKHQNENNDAEEEPLTGRYKVSLTELRKICRCAGILLRNTIELAGCQTDNEKRMKIFDILRERGMKGKPSMNKAETLKLKKEASELNTDNIISDSGRPQRRKVQSRYNKGGNPAADSPKKVTPLKLRLSGLWGIVDSEGSEST